MNLVNFITNGMVSVNKYIQFSNSRGTTKKTHASMLVFFYNTSSIYDVLLIKLYICSPHDY